MSSLLIAHSGPGYGGSAAASWVPVVAFGTVYLVAVVALLALGSPGRHPNPVARFALRAPNALERLTGVPGWAVASAATSMFGLIVAGGGFYSDVAYHIAYGRDEALFTPPHVAILIGLCMIFGATILLVGYATLSRVDTTLRLGPLRIPWSALPLGVIGTGAMLGFPIDELWHQQYGIDVTMWSPPHLMMILGATFTGMASWLVIAESGASPRDSAWARGLHVVAAWLTLLALTAPAGEFAYGVPQWQQLYHPVLLMAAAGIALVTMRIVLGAGWALGVAVVAFGLDLAGILGVGGTPVELRPAGTYVGAALAVEVVALVWGTRPRLRFALLSGVGVGTVGLAVEWAWNTGAHQPWTTALLPEAVIVGLLAALGGAVLGAGFGGALSGQRIGLSGAVLGVALAAVAVALVLPAPRQVGDVHADVTVEHVDEDHVVVHARLDPPDAADDARWFMVGAWQGGDRIGARMVETAPGVYTADRPVPVTGPYKALLRLHRGAEMMTVPIRLPEDPSIGEPEIPAEDRSMAFADEQQYLQREVAAHDPGATWFSWIVFALLAVLAVGWVSSLWIAAAGVNRSLRDDGDTIPTAPAQKQAAAAKG